MEALFAFLMALLFTAIFTMGFQRRGPWSSVVVFFVILFLAGWAASLWLSPVGPAFMGVFWLPIIMVSFLVAVLLSAATPRRPPTQKVETISQVEQEEQEEQEEEETAERVFDVFFWVLVVVFFIVIVLGYAYGPNAT